MIVINKRWLNLNLGGQYGIYYRTNKGNEYFSIDFLEQLKSGNFKSNDTFETIIYNYLYHIGIPLSRSELYNLCDKDDIRSFYYIPIILYIITQYYNEYFHAESSLDLL